jgi:hypothetical protein
LILNKIYDPTFSIWTSKSNKINVLNFYITSKTGVFHHQRLNVLTARAQACGLHIRRTGHSPQKRAQYGLVGDNDCKYSRDQRLNMSSEARRSSRQWIFGHPYNDRPTLLTFAIARWSTLTAGSLSSSFIYLVKLYDYAISVRVL